MWFPQLLLLFAVYSIGPGLFVVRRLRLGPRETLVVAVGASYVFVYLASFGLYLARVDPRWHIGLAVACLGLTLACRRDLARLLRHRSVQRLLGAFAMLAVWVLLLLSFVRHYGGGTWGGDWLEQYHRTIFFLHHRPLGTLLMGKFPLPARPPLMNLVAASFMAQAGAQYEVFQVVYALLNALVLLPCCLLAHHLVRRPGRGLPAVLLLILAANPMAAQNLTYAWTKLFTAFYVILGVHLYLGGWRKRSSVRLVLAFVSMSAGFLVHHSAGPYALFLGLHYVAVVFWRRGAGGAPRPDAARRAWNRRAEAGAIGATSFLLLATWFGWAVGAYGWRTTFTANSTVSDSAVMTRGQNALNIAKNLGNTLVPRVLQHPGILSIEELRQTSTAGRVRDFTFLIYQVSVVFGLGSVGCIAVGYLLYRGYCGAGFPACSSKESGRNACITRSIRRFWLWLAIVVYVAGVAVYGGVDRFGVAHVCLQSLVFMGLTFLAAGFRLLPVPLRGLLLAGILLDLVLGILLHVRLESRDPGIVEQLHKDPPVVALWPSDDTPAQAPQANYWYKMMPWQLLNPPDAPNNETDPLLTDSLPYFGDNFGGLLPFQQAAATALFAVIAWRGLRTLRPGPQSRAAPVTATSVASVPPKRRHRVRR